MHMLITGLFLANFPEVGCVGCGNIVGVDHPGRFSGSHFHLNCRSNLLALFCSGLLQGMHWPGLFGNDLCFVGG